MWVFTPLGFYSATAARDPKTKKPLSHQIQVRARNKAHLQNLIEAFPTHLKNVEINEKDGTDYPCRIYIPKATWVRIAAELAETIEYDNFKGCCHGVERMGKLDSDYVTALHSIWRTMFNYQRGPSKQWGYPLTSDQEGGGSSLFDDVKGLGVTEGFEDPFDSLSVDVEKTAEAQDWELVDEPENVPYITGDVLTYVSDADTDHDTPAADGTEVELGGWARPKDDKDFPVFAMLLTLDGDYVYDVPVEHLGKCWLDNLDLAKYINESGSFPEEEDTESIEKREAFGK